mmetsp:Transcript_15630/g.54296  ORF Transcript_15630/g.54296 Transcript_15630/m.54296 type:complete len:208 (+) Transcript_15630:940-1563(+)
MRSGLWFTTQHGGLEAVGVVSSRHLEQELAGRTIMNARNGDAVLALPRGTCFRKQPPIQQSAAPAVAERYTRTLRGRIEKHTHHAFTQIDPHSVPAFHFQPVKLGACLEHDIFVGATQPGHVLCGACGSFAVRFSRCGGRGRRGSRSVRCLPTSDSTSPHGRPVAVSRGGMVTASCRRRRRYHAVVAVLCFQRLGVLDVIPHTIHPG